MSRRRFFYKKMNFNIKSQNDIILLKYIQNQLLNYFYLFIFKESIRDLSSDSNNSFLISFKNNFLLSSSGE